MGCDKFHSVKFAEALWQQYDRSEKCKKIADGHFDKN
jgi:hypothetical protein